MKFAKITNDKDYPVEVNYKDDEGKEVTATIEAGAELEVPTTAEETVKGQVESAEKPADSADDDAAADANDGKGDDGLTDEERQAQAKKEADEAAADAPVAGDQVATPPAPSADETPEQELVRIKARNAELEAGKAYDQLLTKGKITPGQKDLFLSLAKAGQVTLSAPVKGLKLAKGETTSVITMLSAILEAGPQVIKFGEKGGKGADTEKGELTKEQEEKIVHMGFNLDTFKKQLAKGTISINDLEEGDK